MQVHFYLPCPVLPTTLSLLCHFLQIHSICLALQALRFSTSWSRLFYFTVVQRSHTTYPETQQICGRARGELRSGLSASGIYVKRWGTPSNDSQSCPLQISKNNTVVPKWISTTVLGARWWLYSPMSDKEMIFRIIKLDPGQQQ